MITKCKGAGRRIPSRTCNKTMPRRPINTPAGAVDMCNPEFLSKFTSETGKILPRRVTGVSAKMHRKITREIRRARAVNLLP